MRSVITYQLLASASNSIYTFSSKYLYDMSSVHIGYDRRLDCECLALQEKRTLRLIHNIHRRLRYKM